jgi:hypothetical protein
MSTPAEQPSKSTPQDKPAESRPAREGVQGEVLADVKTGVTEDGMRIESNW